jgi:hypothetical protein
MASFFERDQLVSLKIDYMFKNQYWLTNWQQNHPFVFTSLRRLHIYGSPFSMINHENIPIYLTHLTFICQMIELLNDFFAHIHDTRQLEKLSSDVLIGITNTIPTTFSVLNRQWPKLAQFKLDFRVECTSKYIRVHLLNSFFRETL